jgi:hypothetical protein
MLTRRQLITAHILAEYLIDQNCMSDCLDDLKDYADGHDGVELTPDDVIGLMRATYEMLGSDHPKVVIEVTGGVAECTDDGGCEVLIVDHDNLEEDMALHADAVANRLKDFVSKNEYEAMTDEELLEAGRRHLGDNDSDVLAFAESLRLHAEYQ